MTHSHIPLRRRNTFREGSQWWVLFGFGLILALGLGSCQAGKRSHTPPLRIAAAANLQFVLPVLDSLFESRAGIPVEVTYGASGLLAAQVRQGAPFDLFLSANTAYPDSLLAHGLAAAGPRVYVEGALVWWWKNGRADQLETRLRAARKIALANPRTAPYGLEAERYLRRSGEWATVAERVVYGENIGQVNQFLLTGAAEIGLTAGSVVGSPAMRRAGHWTAVDTALYDPIRQALVITPRGASRADGAAEKFVAFLFEPPARSVWQKYGYRLP